MDKLYGGGTVVVRELFMRCGSCVSSTLMRSTVGFYLLMHTMRSLRRTAPLCCGRCSTSGPVVSAFHLIATTTGLSW